VEPEQHPCLDDFIHQLAGLRVEPFLARRHVAGRDHDVVPEEVFDRVSHGRRYAGVTGRVLGEVRGGGERLPGRIRRGAIVAIRLARADGGDRPPEIEVELGIPARDHAVGKGGECGRVQASRRPEVE
jgi:hypothetical protein